MDDHDRLRRYSKLFGRHGQSNPQGYQVYRTYRERLETITPVEKHALTEFVRDINDVLEGTLNAAYFGRKWQLPIETTDDLRLWIEEQKSKAEELYSLMTEDQREEIDSMVSDILLADSRLGADLIRMAGNLINSGDIPQKTEVPDVFEHGWDDEEDVVQEDETDEDDEEKWRRWM
ncbi:hypothetical protein LCGC14_1692240, partial [marine sediment metagenome]